MKKIKKMILIIVILITVPIVFLTGAVVYINTAYSHIYDDIRLMGVISDLFVRFDDEESLKKLSENAPFLVTKLSDEVSLEETFIETKEGSTLRVLVMKPENQSEIKNAVIWFHGGGYAMKTPEDELGLMQKFVEHNGAVVISPDYTLSVEAPYPAALNDAYATLLWVRDNAQHLGIDEEQIFVGGGSAGGGLTAALSLYARDKGEVNIAFQMPLYPMIDHRSIPNAESEHMLVWDLERNEIAWQVYLGELYGTQDVPEYASPNIAEDFSGLPPTYTFVGTEDPFYEDTIEYVELLRDANVLVEYEIVEGAYHGFDVVASESYITKQAWENLFKSYDYAVENYRTLQP